MPKLFYFAEELAHSGYRYAVYTHDDTEFARKVAADAGARFIAGPAHRPTAGRMIRDIWNLIAKVRKSEIHHADLYVDYHYLAAIAYLLVLWAKRIPIILWCRGELVDWDHYTWQRIFFHLAIPLARLVVLKERYMPATLASAGLYDPAKTIELHNSIPVPAAERVLPFAEPEIRLLFLNSFKTWRNVGFCADVAACLRDRGVAFRVTIVGDKNASHGLTAEAAALSEKIERLALADRVTIAPFSDKPADYFSEHDVFLLPADLVFCNYALIEAMAWRLVPIVNAADDDHRLIVEEGRSGFGRALDAGAWADVIMALAADRKMAQAISSAARRRVIDRFSTKHMVSLYAERAGLRHGEMHQE
jgi:glycosyltransferase involved in cell wall biosynthesis